MSYVHITNDAELAFDLNEFDAIFHSYCVRLPVDGYVSPGLYRQAESVPRRQAAGRARRIRQHSKLRRAIRDIGDHAVLTCVPQRIYPREMFSHTEFITVLTGYVPKIRNCGADRLGTIINAPSSTKNADKARDPEMHA